MKLEISSFADVGDASKERLIIKALSDIDIGGYAVLCSNTSEKGVPTSGQKIAYWFPDGPIKSGDLVILYTKAGKTSVKNLSGQRIAHFYYLGLNSAIWNKETVAVVLRIADWIYDSP